MWSGSAATEQVYVHSKMLIVDDEAMIVGSANINDRSMLGSRDAELAVVVVDGQKMSTKMNGKQHASSEVVHKLRNKCFQQLFGFSEQEAVDPVSDETWNKIRGVSKVAITNRRPTLSSTGKYSVVSRMRQSAKSKTSRR